LVLYFGDEQAEYLVAERRNVEISNGNTVEKAVVEELLKGPTEMGHMKTIPQETKILSIETKNKVCFVNLSKDFVDKHSGGVAAEQLTVYSIVNSLTELGTVDRVQFLIEGEKREDFIHIAFNEPILRNKSIIRK
jgi:spore germination protein GerM